MRRRGHPAGPEHAPEQEADPEAGNRATHAGASSAAPGPLHVPGTRLCVVGFRQLSRLAMVEPDGGLRWVCKRSLSLEGLEAEIQRGSMSFPPCPCARLQKARARFGVEQEHPRNSQ